MKQTSDTPKWEPKRIVKARLLVTELNDSSPECLLALDEIAAYEQDQTIAQLQSRLSALEKERDELEASVGDWKAKAVDNDLEATQAEKERDYWKAQYCSASVDAEFAQFNANEREKAAAELQDQADPGVHSCHDQCQQPMCVLRRERDQLARVAAERLADHTKSRRERDEAREDSRRIEWCAENEIQFGVARGAVGHADRWIVYQKQRWDLPLGQGWTFRDAIDSARMDQPLRDGEADRVIEAAMADTPEGDWDRVQVGATIERLDMHYSLAGHWYGVLNQNSGTSPRVGDAVKAGELIIRRRKAAK